MNHVHGHEVIAMMLNTGEAYSRASLHNKIVERFGSEARFFTCSAEGMTADGLISFLENKGKFQPLEDGFNIDSEKVCQH
ncbi:YecH family protein [bacterium]|nr:YecH family protein [bacterium]